jgi:hypothetical protein
MIHVYAEKAVTEELTYDELWSLTAGSCQHGKYDCVVLNFVESDRPFRKIRVPKVFDSTKFYYGIKRSITRLGYDGKIKMNGHKDRKGVETVLLRRLNVMGEKCNLTKRRDEFAALERGERRLRKQVVILKVINQLSIMSKNRAAYYLDIKREVLKYRGNGCNLRFLIYDGLVKKPKQGYYALTDKGRTLLDYKTKKL